MVGAVTVADEVAVDVSDVLGLVLGEVDAVDVGVELGLVDAELVGELVTVVRRHSSKSPAANDSTLKLSRKLWHRFVLGQINEAWQI